MDVSIQLGTILARVLLSARELDMQPEAFQATVQLRIAASDLATVIRELPPSNDGFRLDRAHATVGRPSILTETFSCFSTSFVV
jgi:hypothetical protein